MDGNGRWAQARGYPRFFGHIRGTARVKEVVRHARTLGIPALTLYAFSTENWKRPETELRVLWRLMQKYLRREVAALKKNRIRLHVIGDISRLPEEAHKELIQAIKFLADGDQMHLTFALSYGSRAEWVGAVRAIAAEVKAGNTKLEQIDERVIEQHLSTSFLGDQGDVDLLIRTSGEQRLSNFLLWQCSYAEFDFPKTLWPDFTVEEFQRSLDNFSLRKRRFGGL